MMFLTKNKKIFVLLWITMMFNWLIGTTANWRIPNEKVQIQNSVRTYPQVHNCILVHLLIKLNFKVGGGSTSLSETLCLARVGTGLQIEHDTDGLRTGGASWYRGHSEMFRDIWDKSDVTMGG